MLKPHELAEALPPLSKDEFDSLADSIKRNKLRDPIVLFEGMILDGCHRYKAVSMLGVELAPADLVDFDGSYEDAAEFVLDRGVRRRNMTHAWRVKVADEIARMVRGRPKNGSREPISQTAAAKKLGVGRESVKRRRRVREKGVPELLDAVDNSVVPLKTAAELTKLPEQEQREAVAAGPAAVKEAVERSKALPPPVLKPVTDDEKQWRAASAGQDYIGKLVLAVKSVDQAAEAFATKTATVPPVQRDLLFKIAGRLRTGADWIEAAVRGDGVSDDALAAWLEENND